MRTLRLAVVACMAFVSSNSIVAGRQHLDVDPAVARLVASVSEARLRDLVNRLAAFRTRNTLSDQSSREDGIGAAAEWIHAELAKIPRLEADFDTYDVPAQGERIVRDVHLRNVIAVLPGRSVRRVYLGGHYDSLARRPAPAGASATGPQSAAGGFDWADSDTPAPGANDDGSGTALTMELARVFAESGLEFDATLVFIAFAGEEQGLVGALLHAQKAEAEHDRIDAVFNNDMVGNSRGGNGLDDGESVRVFSEGPEDSTSRQIARFIRRQAARYVPSHQVRLIARHDRFGRGGDHTAFNQHGFPGVRITESNEAYARQHSIEDKADAVDTGYLARNARVNAAAVGVMALAPAAPGITTDRGQPLLARTPSGYDAHLSWTASPGATAYRVFWRAAWTPDWEHEMVVGNVTEALMPNVSIDDYVFGVAAIGPGGHESLVSVYVNPPRAEVTIRTKQ